MSRPRKPASPFRYFNLSSEVIRLVVLMYVRFCDRARLRNTRHVAAPSVLIDGGAIDPPTAPTCHCRAPPAARRGGPDAPPPSRYTRPDEPLLGLMQLHPLAKAETICSGPGTPAPARPPAFLFSPRDGAFVRTRPARIGTRRAAPGPRLSIILSKYFYGCFKTRTPGLMRPPIR